MRILIPILFLFLPITVLSQSTTSKNVNSQNEFIRPADSKPIVVRGGNAINAVYMIATDSTKAGKYFDLVIYTHSFREALRPFDDEALFMVDGLSKVFKIKNWTSRCVSKQVVSSIIIRLDREEFRSIGYAGTVGLKIGTNTFYLPYRVRHDIRQAFVEMEITSVEKMVFYNPGASDKVVNRIGKDTPPVRKGVTGQEIKADVKK